VVLNHAQDFGLSQILPPESTKMRNAGEEGYSSPGSMSSISMSSASSFTYSPRFSSISEANGGRQAKKRSLSPHDLSSRSPAQQLKDKERKKIHKSLHDTWRNLDSDSSLKRNTNQSVPSVTEVAAPAVLSLGQPSTFLSQPPPPPSAPPASTAGLRLKSIDALTTASVKLVRMHFGCHQLPTKEETRSLEYIAVYNCAAAHNRSKLIPLRYTPCSSTPMRHELTAKVAELVDFLGAVRDTDRDPVLVILSSSILEFHNEVEALNRMLNAAGQAERYYHVVDGTTDVNTFFAAETFPVESLYPKPHLEIDAEGYEKASAFIRNNYLDDNWATLIAEGYLQF
jgi:hypothetical protein